MQTDGDGKAEGSVKPAILILITFLILRLLILIQEAHYCGRLMNAMNQHKHCGLKSSQIILTNSAHVLRLLRKPRGFNEVHDKQPFRQNTQHKNKSRSAGMTDVARLLVFNQPGWMHRKYRVMACSFTNKRDQWKSGRRTYQAIEILLKDPLQPCLTILDSCNLLTRALALIHKSQYLFSGEMAMDWFC